MCLNSIGGASNMGFAIAEVAGHIKVIVFAVVV